MDASYRETSDPGSSGVPAGPWAHPPAPPREPVSRAPWPALLLALGLIALFVLQAATGPEAAVQRFALVPVQVRQGHPARLLTSLFVHGGWTHVLFNAVFVLAFGAPVARLFGLRPGGVLAFVAFFLVCGVLANVGYVLLHPYSEANIVGASGAIAGFMAAASRLTDRSRAGLAPFNSPTVVGMAAAWLVLNLIVGLLGMNIGVGDISAPIAWEVHLIGYAAGLLLIGPAVRLLRRV